MRWVLLTRLPDKKMVWLNLVLALAMGRSETAGNESFTWIEFSPGVDPAWVLETPEEIFSKAIASNWGNL